MKSARPTKMTGPIGFLLVALPLLVAVGPNARPRPRPMIDVQCGDVLDQDWGFYKLSGDLVCPNNPSRAAVTITGEGVHFNLAGFTITPDDFTGVALLAGILVRGAHAHINNGSVVDFNCPILNNSDCAGIFLGEAPGARINGMSLHNNNAGIISFSFGGVFGGVVGNADGARIHGNDITGNLNGGILLSGFGGATAEGAVITDNDLSDTGGFPPAFGYFGSSNGVSLIGNVANNCDVGGILLFGDEASGPTQRNTIRDNTALENGSFGIAVETFGEAFRPHDNLIQSNTAFGNGLSPVPPGIPLALDLFEALFTGSPPAIPFDDCLNTWKDNDFDVAAPDCIE